MPPLVRNLCCLLRPRLGTPSTLREASAAEMADLLPYSYPILGYRNRSFETRGVSVFLAGSQENITPAVSAKLPSQSFLQIVYPFSAAPELSRQYLTPHDGDAHTRWVHNTHLWLEDMDTLAADVAALHSDYRNGDKGLVTAFMDELCWLRHQPLSSTSSPSHPPVADCSHPPSISRADMQLRGQVTWVGKSSMEITLELHELDGASSNEGDPEGGGSSTLVALSRFVMAARTPDFRQAVSVDALIRSSMQDEALFDLGEWNQKQRQSRRHQGTAIRPLDQAEIDLIHKKLGPAVRHMLKHSHSSLPVSEDQGSQGGASQDQAASVKGAAGGLNNPKSRLIAEPDRQAAASQEAISSKQCDTAEKHNAWAHGSAQAGMGEASEPSGDTSSYHHGHIKASSTELHSIYDATWEDRNTTGGTIFGGHLLRLGYEHAAEVAELFAGGAQLDLVHMSEVQFLNPVPVGCTLHLWGRVAFVEGNQVYVHVRASRSDNHRPATELGANTTQEPSSPQSADHEASISQARQSEAGMVAHPDKQPRQTMQEHEHRHQHCVGDVQEHSLRLGGRSRPRPHRPKRPHHFHDPFPHLVKLDTHGFWFVFKMPNETGIVDLGVRMECMKITDQSGNVNLGSKQLHLPDITPISDEDMKRYMHALRKHLHLNATCDNTRE